MARRPRTPCKATIDDPQCQLSAIRPRLPHKSQVCGTKRHAGHKQPSMMLPAMQRGAASHRPGAPPETAQCHKGHACMARSATSATQSDHQWHQTPRLPHKSKVDGTKESRGVTQTNAPPKPAQYLWPRLACRRKCIFADPLQMSHACHRFWTCRKTLAFCSRLRRCTIPCACHA